MRIWAAIRLWWWLENAQELAFEDIRRFNWAMELEYRHFVKPLRRHYAWMIRGESLYADLERKYSFTFPVTARLIKNWNNEGSDGL